MKKSKVFLLVSLTLSSLYVVYIRPVSATEDFWTTMEPMPTGRGYLGVAVVDGKIYAIGGNNLMSSYDTNEMYDPATNTWTTKTSMPIRRGFFGIAVVENKIYCIGGGYGVNQVYDPATDTWENKTSMPTHRLCIKANVVNGKIYIIGGRTSGLTRYSYDVNEVYDPTTDSWTTKTPIPTEVGIYASAVVDNKIYIIGGISNNSTYYNLTQIYDTKTDTWSNGSPIPTMVIGASAGVITGATDTQRIFVIGGGLTQVYDPETDTWFTGAAMLTARNCLDVAVVNESLYAIGGYVQTTSGGIQVAVNERYTPADFIPEFPSWTILPLLLVATVLIILCKKRLPKKPKQPTEISHIRRLITADC